MPATPPISHNSLLFNGEKLFKCLGLSQFDFNGWVVRFDLGLLSLLYFPGSADAKPILQPESGTDAELTHLQITEAQAKGAVIVQFILDLKIPNSVQILENSLSIKASTEITRNHVHLRRLFDPKSPHLLEFVDPDWQTFGARHLKVNLFN